MDSVDKSLKHAQEGGLLIVLATNDKFEMIKKLQSEVDGRFTDVKCAV
jgi:hypothetical protein